MTAERAGRARRMWQSVRKETPGPIGDAGAAGFGVFHAFAWPSRNG